MQAIVLQEPERMEWTDVPECASPGAGEVVVRVHRVGICGTDIHGYLGHFPFYSYPRIPGHELGVEVVELGLGVQGLHVGDLCSVEPYINCERCHACQRGHSNCCENLQVLGVHTDGGLRPTFIVPARKLHVGNGLATEQLALVETLAIGCHAVNRGQVYQDDFALVIGAGPIGLSTMEFVRLAGAQLVVMDMNEERLQFCRQAMGATHTIPFQGDGSELEQLRQITSGRLAQTVIDATGSVKSMSQSHQYAGSAGHLVYVGITREAISLPHPEIHKREITVMTSRNALPGDFTKIIEHIRRGEINTDTWITHRTKIDVLPAEFPAYTRPETGVIKAIVEIPA